MALSSVREDRKSWGERVSERRELLQMSQRAVAARARIPQQTISRVELDRVVPRYSTMKAIADALATTVEDLFPMSSFPAHLRVPKKARAAS